MADVQKYFEKFHSAIRTDYEMSSNLREKRNIIVEKIRKYQEDNGLPGFTKLDQGSYSMKTGVIPSDDIGYDIDVGLRFHITPNEYETKTVRGWVYNAVKDHTNEVEDRGPCVRVIYAEGYHVDLVSYAWVEKEHGDDLYSLAHKDNGWRPAQPVKLLDYVDEKRKKFAGTEDATSKTDQFRRTVRYLRRWYDVQLPGESTAKPIGLAYVLYCLSNLAVGLTWDGKLDDHSPLETLARTAGNTYGRITAVKPTPEYDDTFAKLTGEEMDDLKKRFLNLAEKLRLAKNEADPVKACKILREVFGDDFPVPEPEETAKRTSAPAIVTSSSSA